MSNIQQYPWQQEFIQVNEDKELYLADNTRVHNIMYFDEFGVENAVDSYWSKFHITHEQELLSGLAFLLLGKWRILILRKLRESGWKFDVFVTGKAFEYEFQCLILNLIVATFRVWMELNFAKFWIFVWGIILSLVLL